MPKLRNRALLAIAEDLLARNTRGVDLARASAASGVDVAVLEAWFPIPDLALRELLEYQSWAVRAVRAAAQFELNDPVTVLRQLFEYFGEALRADPLLLASLRLQLAVYRDTGADSLHAQDPRAPGAPALPWTRLVEEQMEFLQTRGRVRPGIGGSASVRMLLDATLAHIDTIDRWNAVDEVLRDLAGEIIGFYIVSADVFSEVAGIVVPDSVPCQEELFERTR